MKITITGIKTSVPRQPSADEIDELIVHLWTELGHPFPLPLPNEEFGKVIQAVKNAHIRVYENCWIRGKYVNRVMTVLWKDDGQRFESETRFIWQGGKLTAVSDGESFWQKESHIAQIPAKLQNKLTNEIIPKAGYSIRSLFVSHNQDEF